MNHIGNCFAAPWKSSRTAPGGDGLLPLPFVRSWSGGPVNAFSLWKRDAVARHQGARKHVATHIKTPLSERKYCKKCGGHLMTNHPPLG